MPELGYGCKQPEAEIYIPYGKRSDTTAAEI
jgi:hypothetical protein